MYNKFINFYNNYLKNCINYDLVFHDHYPHIKYINTIIKYI